MKLRFISKKPEGKDVVSFVFEPEEKLSWQPGQYMHYVLEHPDADEKGVERWFTISAAPFEGHIMLTTRLDNLPLSTFKQALNKLNPGDTIEADGPKGKFVLQEGEHKHVMIAGGIGVTPFRSMLVQLDHDHQNINAELLYLNRDDNFVFDEELAQIAGNNPQFKIDKIVDKRLSQADFEPYTKDNSAVYYLSGPHAMVESYEAMLKGMGIAEDNMLTDYFPGY
jgi:ferredoxin-NADP reductase